MSPETPNVPDTLVLNISEDTLRAAAFSRDPNKRLLAVGSASGRVRLFDCNTSPTQTLLQKRWHRSIRGLDFYPLSHVLVSVSSESGIKVHDLESGKCTWVCLHAHERTPISSLLVLEDNRWATGDEDGVLKIWDGRDSSAKAVLSIAPAIEEDEATTFEAINDLAIGLDPRGLLLAAVDDGSLVTYNLRRRRIETKSETLGYSARSVEVMKNHRKVLVGTDEGVVAVFTWNEFGNLCDRIPVRAMEDDNQASSLSSLNSVECMTRITEDVVAVGLDNGSINALSILPNRHLGLIGRHGSTGEQGSEDVVDGGGDCLVVAVSPQADLLAAVCPSDSRVTFHSVSHLEVEAEAHEEQLRLPKKQRRVEMSQSKSRKSGRNLVSQQTSARSNFLSGLLPAPSANGDDSDGDSSEGDTSDLDSTSS